MSTKAKIISLHWLNSEIVSAKVIESAKAGAESRLSKADSREPRYISLDQAEDYRLTVNEDGSVDLPKCCGKDCNAPCGGANEGTTNEGTTDEGSTEGDKDKGSKEE